MRKTLFVLSAILMISTVNGNARVKTIEEKLNELDARVSSLEEGLMETTELLKRYIREDNLNTKLVRGEIAELKENMYYQVKENVIKLLKSGNMNISATTDMYGNVVWTRKKDAGIKTDTGSTPSRVTTTSRVVTESKSISKKIPEYRTDSVTTAMPDVKIEVINKRNMITQQTRPYIIATIVNISRPEEAILKAIRDIERVIGKNIYIYTDSGFILLTADLTLEDIQRLKSVYPFYNPIIRKNKSPAFFPVPVSREEIRKALLKAKKEREMRLERENRTNSRLLKM